MREWLLWARLYASGNKGVTEAALKKDVLPIFVRVMGKDRGHLDLEHLVDAELTAGNVERSDKGKSIKFQLSQSGIAKARKVLPYSAMKTWSAITKTELAAHALGIHDEISSAQMALLSRAGTVQLVVLRQHFELDVPILPTAAQLEQALLWHAMRSGLSDEVYAWAKGRKPGLPLVLGALTASLADVRPSDKKAEVFNRVVAAALGARNSTDLHAALLTRLVEARVETERTPSESKSTLGTAGARKSDSERHFAAKVLSAARRSRTGKLDSSLILINHAHAQFAKEHPDEAGSLDTFKQQLWSAALDGHLTLASADMPQVLDPNDYSASRIQRGASVFSLIRI